MFKIVIVLLVSLILLSLIIFYNNSGSNELYQNRQQYKLPKELIPKTPKALVLGCIDFRFQNEIIYFLNGSGLKNAFNGFNLAGSSLGFNQNKFKEWAETFDKHIQLSIQLHDIQEIIVIDHMDCGAYRILYDNPNLSKEDELDLHKKNLDKIREVLGKKYSNLVITSFLMDVDGSVIERK
jgi:carbonic anhydrase